ncbi:kinase-like domain-containing protein, partial [Hyaloraphidium curvatum]
MQPAREAGRRPGDGRPSGTAVPGSSGSAGTDRTAGADAKPRLARSKTSFWVEENDISYDRDVCLGKGGFGIVYRGKYLGLTDVAVKVALDVYSTEQADAFLEAEVKVWAELPAHRNVVPLLGYRTAPTLLITELFHGGSMKSFLEKKAWDRDLALRLLADAAVGMTFLHSKGVVHSDLKAENVLVDDTGGTPVAKIADFGLAKVRTRVEDTQGNKAYQYRGLAGATIRYAPPEFFEDEPLRKPSDVWTFAMMCYQVFSGGRDPYENLSSAPAIMKAMFRGDRPSRPDGVPDAVWELMVSCWAEEMEARPTMIAVATALKRVLEQPAVKKAVWVEVTDVEIFRDRPLGSGGFGEVFRGRFRGADVAVKVIDGTMEEDRARALFEAELKMWIDVPQHRNLVPLIAYRANPTFLVTELCSGGSLKSYLSSKGWPKPLSLQLLANAAAGIEVLHAAGIAHSDLKADNVLVSFDAAGNPVGRIADFGISKLRTRVHDSKGNKGYDYKGVYGATVRFAPPEFFDQEPMGRQSDVWTFGMMCYEVLSGGREPYEDLTSPAAVMRAIFTGSRPPQPPGISSAVWSLVEQCWREERSERPAMAELAEVLLEESASADQERRDREEREADARARRETEEQARKDAEKHARKKAEERARKEAEEQARKEAEEQARKEAEEQARKEAEE